MDAIISRFSELVAPLVALGLGFLSFGMATMFCPAGLGLGGDEAADGIPRCCYTRLRV